MPDALPGSMAWQHGFCAAKAGMSIAFLLNFQWLSTDSLRRHLRRFASISVVMSISVDRNVLRLRDAIRLTAVDVLWAHAVFAFAACERFGKQCHERLERRCQHARLACIDA